VTRLADFLSPSVIARLYRGQAPEQQRATEQLRALAKPHRFRVRADAEGFPIIPARYGQIEWYCDGKCASRALPGQFALAVYTDRPRLFEKLWAIPGMKRHQTGDTEMRAVFLAEDPRAGRRGHQGPPEAHPGTRGGAPTAVQTHTQSDFRRLEATINARRGQRAE
jgi:hypothetical protein